MSSGEERFYELLPGYLRNRDWYEGEPLRALLAVLEAQFSQLEGDVGRLYEDWFVETCQERIVPLLGDLLGVRGLGSRESWVPGQRTRVANSLAYRQAKGTAATLARVARDVTGWPATARAGFRDLLFAQPLASPRLERGRTPDLRQPLEMSELGGPFDRCQRTVRVTGGPPGTATASCQPGAGLGDLVCRLWRLASFPVRQWTARPLGAGCFSFHPVGFDMPLLTRRRSPQRPSREIGPEHLPQPLRRAALERAIAARCRGELEAARSVLSTPPFEIVDPETGQPVPWQAIAVADLAGWPEPAATVPFTGTDGTRLERRIRLAVDPELGRFRFVRPPAAAASVQVSACYGARAEIGGGVYERPSLASRLERPHSLAVGGGEPEPEVPQFPSLLAAVDARPPESGAQVLLITDSATYGGVVDLPLLVKVRPGGRLLIEAAPGQFPCYLGNLLLVAGGSSPATRITLSGLLIGGTIELRGAATLELHHCTVMRPPERSRGAPALTISGRAHPGTTIRIERSITGPLWLPAAIGGVEILDSIVDGFGGPALAAGGEGGFGPPASLLRTTVLGTVAACELRGAADSLITGGLRVERPSSGSMRHCYCPPGAGPARQACLPDGPLAAAGDDAAREELAARLRPGFVSRSYGQPGYAQLTAATPSEIRSGSSGGSELGAFERLRTPQRERNLAEVLTEYLPWGLEPRIRYET